MWVRVSESVSGFKFVVVEQEKKYSGPPNRRPK